MTPEPTEALIEKMREALGYYFVPGEHPDRPYVEGLSALTQLAERMAYVKVLEEALGEIGRLFHAQPHTYREIARAALSERINHE